MQFGYTIIYVPDVAASLAFFTAPSALPAASARVWTYGELEPGATPWRLRHTHSVRHIFLEACCGAQCGAASGMEIALVHGRVPERQARCGSRRVCTRGTDRKPWGQIVPMCAALTGPWSSSAQRWAPEDTV